MNEPILNCGDVGGNNGANFPCLKRKWKWLVVVLPRLFYNSWRWDKCVICSPALLVVQVLFSVSDLNILCSLH